MQVIPHLALMAAKGSNFDIKIAALRCHKSQIGDNPSPDLEQWLRQRCKMMAEGEDYELAEAFHRVKIQW